MRALAAYNSYLPQYAAFLQRKLRESNFRPSAWGEMQQAMQQHIQLTQTLMRLPAPAPNRNDIQRVDVIATTIPMVMVCCIVLDEIVGAERRERVRSTADKPDYATNSRRSWRK